MITHCRQQAPVDLLFLGCFLEELFVLGQALLQVLGEGVGADVAKHVHMPVVTVLETLQGAVFFHLVQVGVDLVKQAVVFTCSHRPALAARIAQVKGHAHVGEVHLVHRHFIGVDQGEVNLAFIDHAQQVDHFNGVGFVVLDPGILLFQLGQLLGMGAALEHGDALAHQVSGRGRPRLAVAVDDLRCDFEVGVGKPGLLQALLAADQAGSSQNRAVRLAQLVEHVVQVVGGFDLELDPKVVGKAFDQLVFEAGFTVAILKIGRGAVTGNHPQYPVLLYTLQGAGFFNAGTEHQEESGCEQPFGAARADIS